MSTTPKLFVAGVFGAGDLVVTLSAIQAGPPEAHAGICIHVRSVQRRIAARIRQERIAG
jgi:hypothetical protein